MGENKSNKGYVNTYELNDGNIKQLRTLRFELPTTEWVDFVMLNRTQKDFVHDFDVVYGSVALYEELEEELNAQ